MKGRRFAWCVGLLALLVVLLFVASTNPPPSSVKSGPPANYRRPERVVEHSATKIGDNPITIKVRDGPGTIKIGDPTPGLEYPVIRLRD